MKYMLLIYSEGTSLDRLRTGVLFPGVEAARTRARAKRSVPGHQSTSTCFDHDQRPCPRRETPPNRRSCAETGEQLGRYSLVDRENGEAVEIAGRIPRERKRAVEIRPVVQITGRRG